MNKIILSYFIFLTAILGTQAQTILLEENVPENIGQENNYGQNLKKFGHYYINYEFILGNQDSKGSEIIEGKSAIFAIGLRKKLKIKNWYSIGYDVSLNLKSFHLQQNKDTKTFPNSITHNTEKFLRNSVQLEIYNRLSLGKRGNYIKYFFDLGTYIESAYSRLYTIDKGVRQNGISATHKFYFTNLDFVNFYDYGAKARIGYNRFIMSASYRFSDLFKSNTYIELPRFALGIQIAFY